MPGRSSCFEFSSVAWSVTLRVTASTIELIARQLALECVAQDRVALHPHLQTLRELGKILLRQRKIDENAD